MAEFPIPDDLVRMLREQRAIPFIGAGFSSVHGLPTWNSLLGDLAAELQYGGDPDETIDFHEIQDACGNDPLQIAEFLYLRAGESIGPIRHVLSSALRATEPILTSTPHIELANLGAPQVYTTNFDDLIERTYRDLGLEVDVVAIARDVARSNPHRTQVVKYHGDLRHENTLVLTESAYYSRLEFESPMDLQLRSDLLGRAVLFMGYSFRDINIRVMWFKLMEMMKDVPAKDRPPSYIVRLQSNPVMDVLYESVGLKTIVIDPDGTASTTDDRNTLLGQFALELAMQASQGRATPGGRPAFVSAGLLDAIDEEIASSEARVTLRARRSTAPFPAVATTRLLFLIRHLTAREIPALFLERSAEMLLQIARQISMRSRGELAHDLVSWFVPTHGPHPGATLAVGVALMRESTRKPLMRDAALPWSAIWQARLDDADAGVVLELFREEVEGHEDEAEPFEDFDLAYGADVVKRIANGQIFVGDDAVREDARELLRRAASVYPALDEYEPGDSAPAPHAVVSEIRTRLQELEDARTAEEEEGE